MINYNYSNIDAVSVHYVGNKNNSEDLKLSKKSLDISDIITRELLLKYFISSFKSEEFYSFTFSNDNFKLNPLYIFATEIFSNKSSFHKKSIDISKHLFGVSNHPQIKGGELFVAYFSELLIDDEVTDAIGIFKSENRQQFLKLNSNKNEYSISYERGINVDKLDKGCLIFNTEQRQGYKISIVDNINKGIEAQFWKDEFLKLCMRADNYHKTSNYLKVTKDYVVNNLQKNFNLDKTEQIKILNRSIEYFRTNDSFDKKDYINTIFEKPEMIRQFKKYEKEYFNDNLTQISDSFEISENAVKKQSRIFKSVLKLDKNFHIYIHGDTELIEKCIDKDGRKYYKIYFENET